MRTETRSKDSDRKWVLFVLCGTRCFIKPVYVRDIVLHGSWAAGKHIHKYRDTTWRDNKSYVIMLLLTGSAPQTKKKNWNQTEHKEVCINVEIHMYTVRHFNKRLVPIQFPILCPLRQKSERGARVQSQPPWSFPSWRTLDINNRWYVTHETQAYSEGVKYSDTQGVKTGKTQ